MDTRTFTITDQPQLISSWVPPLVLVTNRGTAPVFLGGRDVSSTSYTEALHPRPEVLQDRPLVHCREIATSQPVGLFAVTAGDSVDIDVLQYGGGGHVRLDVLRALASRHTGGTPVSLLEGDNLEDLIDSAMRAANWVTNVLTMSRTEPAV